MTNKTLSDTSNNNVSKRIFCLLWTIKFWEYFVSESLSNNKLDVLVENVQFMPKHFLLLTSTLYP